MGMMISGTDRSMPGRRLIRRTMSADSSLGARPMRLMPVSTAMWIRPFFPRILARLERRSAFSYWKMAGEILQFNRSSNRIWGVTPSTRMGFWIPWRLRIRASSMVATPYPAT